MSKYKYILFSLILAVRMLWVFGNQSSQTSTNDPVIALQTVVASNVKDKFNNVYQAGLPSPQASLLSGIVLGGRSVDKGVKNRLTNVGLSHIVAASGMNLTFIAGIAYFFLFPLKIKKIYKVGIAILFISFYATITGFDPPIVRALIMSLVVTVAGLLGRQSSMTTGLAIAVFIMLWVNPLLVISPSFLLSFTAVVAQVSLSGLVFGVPKWMTPVIEVCLQSFFASVFTLPVILIFFGRISPISVFINPVVLWTIEPLMILGGLAGIVGMVWIEAGKFILLPAGVLLSFIFKMVDLATQISGSGIEFKFNENSLALLFTGGYYLFLSCLVLKFRQQFCVKK